MGLTTMHVENELASLKGMRGLIHIFLWPHFGSFNNVALAAGSGICPAAAFAMLFFWRQSRQHVCHWSLVDPRLWLRKDFPNLLQESVSPLSFLEHDVTRIYETMSSGECNLIVTGRKQCFEADILIHEKRIAIHPEHIVHIRSFECSLQCNHLVPMSVAFSHPRHFLGCENQLITLKLAILLEIVGAISQILA